MNDSQLKPICEVLAGLTSGSQITHMFQALNLFCDLPVCDTKWKRLYNAIANSYNHTHTSDALIRIIEWMLNPARYIENQDTFYEARDLINKHLSFLGLELLPNGKVQEREVATTLEEANQTASRLKQDLFKFHIHPQIMAFCRPEIISENLFHLVFEAVKCVLNELRSISGLPDDGNTLVNKCFDGANPLVVMNKLSNQTEKSEHKGLQALLNAIVYLYRNPKAHFPKYLSSDDYQSTLEALIMISRARYTLDRCFRNNSR